MFDETKYKIEFQDERCKIWVPLHTANYHTCRLQEAMRQNLYASSGVSRDALIQHLNAIVELCNITGELSTIKTDIGSICNALLYRTNFPVDEHCETRLGMALSFVEFEHDGNKVYENPDKVEWFYSKKKEEFAFQNMDLYAFFLSLGTVYSGRYNQYLDVLKDTDYFVNRMETLMKILPATLSRLSRV